MSGPPAGVVRLRLAARTAGGSTVSRRNEGSAPRSSSRACQLRSRGVHGQTYVTRSTTRTRAWPPSRSRQRARGAARQRGQGTALLGQGGGRDGLVRPGRVRAVLRRVRLPAGPFRLRVGGERLVHP